MGTKLEYAVILMIIFFLSALLAVIIVSIYPDAINIPIATKSEIITNASTDLGNFFITILIRNLSIAFIILSSSIARQKIIPAAIIASNGFAICAAIFKAIQLYGIGMLIPFVPHAIIELPAIILVGVYSFVAVDEFKKASPYSTIREYLMAKLHIPRAALNQYIFRPYFLYVTPMFIIAAAIEAYISSQLLIIVVNAL
jgi:uncharacterized membrane protein SpoIIM required for sporulation